MEVAGHSPVPMTVQPQLGPGKAWELLFEKYLASRDLPSSCGTTRVGGRAGGLLLGEQQLQVLLLQWQWGRHPGAAEHCPAMDGWIDALLNGV